MIMDKRYQIFVSSTYEDLKNERAKVMETILNFDCFPAGMERFPAMSVKMFEYIKKIIDDSDYYLLIIGGRYGSVDKRSGKSWTEQEFDYAVSKGIPIMVFDHKDFSKLPAYKTDQDDEKRNKLLEFKEKAKTGRLINKWSSADNLALSVSNSLRQIFDMQPRIGWVRTDKVASEDAQKEINRLKKEIASHQDEIKTLEVKVEGLEAQLKTKDANIAKKEKDYDALKPKYQAAQQVIENNKERIYSLETELKRIKSVLNIETFTVRGVSFGMVHVEGGKFVMGAKENEEGAFSNEEPAHEVTLSDYWIGETPVTRALWRAVMGDIPSYSNRMLHPVVYVTWIDCQKFIKRINELTGKKFHLPTEEQWEFAARGGNKSKGFNFAGSNEINDVAWYEANSEYKTHPVGKKHPNELGLYDMSGNVWEWCQDWFDTYYNYNLGQYKSTNPTTDSYGVCRGGSSNSSAPQCRLSFRNYIWLSKSENNLGLRLAL